MPATAANTDALHAWVGFKPDTRVVDGVKRFVDWYRGYYNKMSRKGIILAGTRLLR